MLQWKGKFLQVLRCGHWEYAERVGTTGAVAIVAITRRRELLVTEQYRIPVKARVLELPAGLVGDAPGEGSEPSIEAARRELLEETGYAAEGWVGMASGPPQLTLQPIAAASWSDSGIGGMSPKASAIRV